MKKITNKQNNNKRKKEKKKKKKKKEKRKKKVSMCVYTQAKRSHKHVKDPLVHVRVM